eukprot:scaffold63872_cov35-Prasinocladus_malaysianus.AAC.1
MADTPYSAPVRQPATGNPLDAARKLIKFGDDWEVEGSTCCNCTKGSAKWVMDHVIAYLTEKCESTEC